jgi:hypothetical protein
LICILWRHKYFRATSFNRYLNLIGTHFLTKKLFEFSSYINYFFTFDVANGCALINLPVVGKAKQQVMKEALKVISLNSYKRETTPEFFFFNVAESHEKLFVHIPDILLVTADVGDSRNKMVCIKTEPKEYTLMNITFQRLLEYNPGLIPVNKFTLVSVEAIYTHRYDYITLKNIFTGWNKKQITLNRNYRKEFYRRVGK